MRSPMGLRKPDCRSVLTVQSLLQPSFVHILYISVYVCYIISRSLPAIYIYIYKISLSLSLNLSLLFLISAIFIYNLFLALSLRPLALGSFDPREAL